MASFCDLWLIWFSCCVWLGVVWYLPLVVGGFGFGWMVCIVGFGGLLRVFGLLWLGFG